MDVNSKNITNGNSSLYYASHNNEVELAQLLIDNGAIINTNNIYGDTPLHYAKSDEMRKLLKSYGAKE